MEKIKKMLVTSATRRLGLLEYDIEGNMRFIQKTIWMSRKTVDELLCVKVEYKKGRRVLTFDGNMEDNDLINNYNFFYFSQVLNYAFSYENIELFFRDLLDKILSKTIDMSTSKFILDIIKRELSIKHDVVEVVQATTGKAPVTERIATPPSPTVPTIEAPPKYENYMGVLKTLLKEYTLISGVFLFKNNKYDHHKVRLFKILNDMKTEVVAEPVDLEDWEGFLLGQKNYCLTKNIDETAEALETAIEALETAKVAEKSENPEEATPSKVLPPNVDREKQPTLAAGKAYEKAKIAHNNANVQSSKNDLDYIIRELDIFPKPVVVDEVQIWLKEAKALSPNYDEILAEPGEADHPDATKMLEKMKVATILSYTLNKVEIAINQQIDKLYYFTRLPLHDLFSMLYDMDKKYLKSHSSSIIDHSIATMLLLTIIVEQNSSKNVCRMCRLYYSSAKKTDFLLNRHVNDSNQTNYFCYLRSRSISLSECLLGTFTDGVNAFIVDPPPPPETLKLYETQCRGMTSSDFIEQVYGEERLHGEERLDGEELTLFLNITIMDLTQEEMKSIVREYLRIKNEITQYDTLIEAEIISGDLHKEEYFEERKKIFVIKKNYILSFLRRLEVDISNGKQANRIELEYAPQLKYLDLFEFDTVSTETFDPSHIKFATVINPVSETTVNDIREFMETWGLVPSDNIDMVISFFDDDENGVISDKELQDTVLTYYFHEECCLDSFSKFDLDHDGLIDLDEFIDYFIHLGLGDDRPTIKTIFNELDKSKDNKISYREFKYLFQLQKTFTL